jgi:hypothetical protein
MKLKTLAIVTILFTSNSLSANGEGIKDFLQMTTGATVMPTILPTYVTVMHYNPPPGLERSEKISKFTTENFDVLKEEIVKGEGEHLDTLAVMYELEKKDEWKRYLQTHFDEIFIESKSKEERVHKIDEITYDKFIIIERYEVVDNNGTYGVVK